MTLWNRLDLDSRWLLGSTAILWAVQLVYLLSPIDVLPDIIPLVGWTDDLLTLLATLGVTAVTANRVLRDPGVGDLIPDALRPRTMTAAPAHLTEPEEPAAYRPLSPEEIRRM